MSIYAAISAYIVVSTSLSKKALVELSIGVKCFFRKDRLLIVMVLGAD